MVHVRLGENPKRTRPKQEKPQNEKFVEKDPASILRGQAGGRPQGRVVKAGVTMAIELLKTRKITPLEYLLDLMEKSPAPRYHGESYELYYQRLMLSQQLRFEAAKAASPYMHPKIGPIDPKEFRDEKDLAASIANDLREMMAVSNVKLEKAESE